MIENTLLQACARASLAAYDDQPAGATHVFDGEVGRATLTPFEGYLIVAFRGTRTNHGGDWEADIDAALTDAVLFDGRTVRVHRGFLRSTEQVEQQLFDAIAWQNLPVVVTGHSLGGSEAAIFAARHPAVALITFGQPRAGNAQFAAYVEERFQASYQRFVHHTDIVPTLPPTHFGFAHAGRLVLFAEESTPAASSPLAWIVHELEPDAIEDHSMAGYAALVREHYPCP